MNTLQRLFQTNYVRAGALFGAISGYWGQDYLIGVFDNPIFSTFIFAFLGWGMGLYLGEIRGRIIPQKKRQKFQVHQGGKARNS